MSKPPPTMSIIIPTHNRCAALVKNLHALARQSCPMENFEVLVVADACQDDTAEMVSSYSLESPYRLRLFCHSARSAASTRNLGASNAQGKVFLFLDDDVIPQQGLVQAHLEMNHLNGVVLGYAKSMVPAQPTWCHYNARLWWEDTFREMQRPGHRFSYRDFISANVSMPAELFHRVSGFDASFTNAGFEDFEFGIRLLKAGARFYSSSNAIGYHYDNTCLERWLQRLFQEGSGSILIGQRHPELRSSLFGQLEEPGGPYARIRRIIRNISLTHLGCGGLFEAMLLRQAKVLEQLRMRSLWKKVFWTLGEYNYWRGVAATIGGIHEFAAWLQEAPMQPAVEVNAPIIDLLSLPGDETLEEILQIATKSGLRLTLGDKEVYAIAPKPGFEPLRKEHLHSTLRELSREQFVPVLAFDLVRSTPEGRRLCLSSLLKST